MHPHQFDKLISVGTVFREMFAEQEAIIENSSGVIHPGKSNPTIFALNQKCEVMTTLSRISPALVDNDFL